MLNRWRLNWALRRNQMIGSVAARGLATWLPPARVPARRYARRLFDLTAGFVYSQIVQALVTSGLLEGLATPLTLDEAAATAELSHEATLTLVRSAASLDLVEERGGRWMLSGLGAALAATPGLADMIRHHRLFYADLADPLAMLRREGAGQLARLWRYDGAADPRDVASYSALMAATQPMIAEQVLAACGFRESRALLDVGGGTGGFLRAVGARWPHLQLGLFDRPGVVSTVSEFETHAGSFLEDALPAGYDTISLVRVLHDHDDAPVAALLAAARRALPPGGRLVIAEPLADTPGAESMGHGYFGFYLAAMRSGRPRTFAEYRELLASADFSRVDEKAVPVPLITGLIVAKP